METPQVEPAFVAVARERMTWQEICDRYPDEWVTLTAFEWEDGNEDDGELLSAVVLGHSAKRGESLRATRTLRELENVTDVWERFTGDLFPQAVPIS